MKAPADDVRAYLEERWDEDALASRTFLAMTREERVGYVTAMTVS